MVGSADRRGGGILGAFLLRLGRAIRAQVLGAALQP